MTKACTWLMYCVVSNRVPPYILLVSVRIIMLSALPLTIMDFGIIFFLSENVIGVLISAYQAGVVDTWHSTILDLRLVTYDLIHFSQTKPYRSVTLTDWEPGHYLILKVSGYKSTELFTQHFPANTIISSSKVRGYSRAWTLLKAPLTIHNNLRNYTK